MVHMLYLSGIAEEDQPVSCARLALANQLAEWQLTELLDDARVIISELVTNAARLGKVFTLTILRPAEGTLRIEVEDSSPAVPKRRDPLADLGRDDPDDNGGRGLVLVEALSDTWGYDLLPAGKVVWATLSCH
jgi:anti-sigma regulatory factor (Ser/Thr protein kinase)